MSTITVYTNPGCAQCGLTVRALDKTNLPYSTVDLSTDDAASPKSRNSVTHRPR